MRLTNAVCKEILDKAILKRFKDRDDAIIKEQNEIADKVYFKEYGSLERIALQLPEGWRNMRNALEISSDGLKDSYKERRFLLLKPRPFPNFHDAIVVKSGHPCYKQLQEHLKKKEVIAKEKQELTLKLNTLLKSVTTAKQLLLAWPQAKEFLPAERKLNLPVPFDLANQLNKMLGLKGA